MRLNGIGVSPGIGIGKALVLKGGMRDLRFRIPAARVDREIQRLEGARTRARRQIEQLKTRIAASLGVEHGYLFDAQLLMLDDAMLVDRAIEIIRDDRLNAESALQRVLDDISALFDQADDPYVRERKGDVGDVVGRLRMNLRESGGPLDLFRDLDEPHVLVADELTPSMIAQIDWHHLAAIITDAGSWTYHSAILARSIHVPAVAGIPRASAVFQPGMLLAVDGGTGEVIVNPDAESLGLIETRRQRRAAYEQSLEEFRRLPAVTEDGVALRLEVNVEAPDDAVQAREQGADGVGLFRSEFLLASRGEAGLTEDTQYHAYRQLVEAMAPARVTIRTFDVSEGQIELGAIGADEPRAPLGLRGLRLSLAREDLFQAQIRALLRAAAHGSLRIMFPFVSGLEELRRGRAAVARAARALREQGIDVPPVPVGVMIEVPSAALTADILATEADFFSIGTNDLIQYCLAVDRNDDRVSQLYEPLHPAILRMLRVVARAGRRSGIPVAVCGEMAADPALLTLLVGLGLREFSMAATAIPLAKQVLRGLNAKDAARLAIQAGKARTADEVEQALIRFLAPVEARK